MFKDRKDAGKKLLALMKDYEKIECIVYGLPRGGVPVAYEIAVGLNKPLEVLIVKKLGLPGEEELALGAIAEGEKPSLYLNSNLMLNYGYSEKDMRPYIETKLKDISRLQQIFRKNEKMMVNTNGTAILVDDGISTGATVVYLIQRRSHRLLAPLLWAGRTQYILFFRNLSSRPAVSSPHPCDL